LYKNAPTVALIFAMASPAFAAKGFGSCEDLTRSAQWSNGAVSYRDDGHKVGKNFYVTREEAESGRPWSANSAH
jgi:hypothetical protein